MTIEDPEKLIADMIEARLVELRMAGLPGDLILATTLATTLGIVADLWGGKVAADCARFAAARVEGLPKRERPARPTNLAEMPAMSRA